MTGGGSVAYVVSWLPAITETFILEEVKDLRSRGVAVEVFPLFGGRGGEVHATWRDLEACTHYHANVSWELVAAQLHWIRRRPRAYLRAWWGALRGNAPSRKLLLRTPFVVAKAALIARQLASLGVTHVHAHWATHPTLAAWVVHSLTGVGYSFTTHAHDLYVDRAMLREKVDRARFVVTISDFNRAILEGHCGPATSDKLHVVRCGVDLSAFAPCPRTPPVVPTFACVAGLREYKGHDVLLDACRMLRDRDVPVRVVLVGEGELRRHLEARIAKERLGGIVDLLGALPHERIPDVLATCTAMVLPSVRARDGQMEGIPVALMEAMAVGVPVLATRLSGVPELVEDGVSGLLVPERDAAALALAMERLAADPALGERLADGARRTIRARFDRRRNVATLGQLLDGARRCAPPARRHAQAEAAETQRVEPAGAARARLASRTVPRPGVDSG